MNNKKYEELLRLAKELNVEIDVSDLDKDENEYKEEEGFQLEEHLTLINSLSKEFKIALDYLQGLNIDCQVCSKNVLVFHIENHSYTYSFKSKKWKQNGKGKWYSGKTVRDVVEKIKANLKKFSQDKLPLFNASDVEGHRLSIHTPYSIENIKELGRYTAYKIKDHNIYLWSNPFLDRAFHFSNPFMLVPICSLYTKKEYLSTYNIF